MVRVAVAGGSGSIGRAIFDAINESQLHEAFIFSRTSRNDSKTIAVDYSDVKKLQEALETHQIQCVISALSIGDDESGQAQMNLIEAAMRCQCTQRFMPSEFGAKYDEEAIRDLPAYAWKFKAISRLKETDLEYTQFSNSMFMDLWFAPHIKSSFRFNIPSWVDLDNNIAAIPGDGNSPIVLTHSRDIAQFVVAALGLPRWEKRYYLIGDRFTINEFVSMAEEIKGIKFEKCYDDVEMLERGECTILPAVKEKLPAGVDPSIVLRQVALTGKRITKGGLDLPTTEGNINNLFPEMKTLKLQEAIRIYCNSG